jgi:hypothetical protein
MAALSQLVGMVFQLGSFEKIGFGQWLTVPETGEPDIRHRHTDRRWRDSVAAPGQGHRAAHEANESIMWNYTAEDSWARW